MKRLQELTEGLVICVHHTGKDASKGMRGHSSLHAALDIAIEVGRGDLTRWWKAAKVKDGADDRTRGFKLNVIDLGIDVDGDAITSCAIEPDSLQRNLGLEVRAVGLSRGLHSRPSL
nr:hypothetical protein [uncultured Sandarakinorhabdus sp.]